MYPSVQSTTREQGTIIRSHMSICCGVGMATFKHQTIAERCEHTHRIHVRQPDERKVLGCRVAQRSLRVASIVSDRFVERGEEPLVCRCQDNQMPAPRELTRRQLELRAVVRDVFEHVHIENRIKLILLIEVSQRADSNVAAVG